MAAVASTASSPWNMTVSGFQSVTIDTVRRVHESTCPVDDALVERLTEPLHCLATVEGLAFSDSDRRSGPWRNYFVGVVGAVAADENDVLWPNQVPALPSNQCWLPIASQLPMWVFSSRSVAANIAMNSGAA